MELQWITYPSKDTINKLPPKKQVKAMVNALVTYEKLLRRELQEVEKLKAEIVVMLLKE